LSASLLILGCDFDSGGRIDPAFAAGLMRTHLSTAEKLTVDIHKRLTRISNSCLDVPSADGVVRAKWGDPKARQWLEAVSKTGLMRDFFSCDDVVGTFPVRATVHRTSALIDDAIAYVFMCVYIAWLYFSTSERCTFVY
jgi:hypothetical protein